MQNKKTIEDYSLPFYKFSHGVFLIKTVYKKLINQFNIFK